MLILDITHYISLILITWSIKQQLLIYIQELLLLPAIVAQGNDVPILISRSIFLHMTSIKVLTLHQLATAWALVEPMGVYLHSLVLLPIFQPASVARRRDYLA